MLDMNYRNMRSKHFKNKTKLLLLITTNRSGRIQFDLSTALTNLPPNLFSPSLKDHLNMCKRMSYNGR